MSVERLINVLVTITLIEMMLLIGLQVVRIGGRSLFALAPNLALALVPFFAESMIRAAFQPLFNAWLIRRTDESIRATVLSTTSVANALGQIGGGPVAGAIGNAFGIPAALLSTAVMLIPGAAFFARATAVRRSGGRGRTTRQPRGRHPPAPRSGTRRGTAASRDRGARRGGTGRAPGRRSAGPRR